MAAPLAPPEVRRDPHAAGRFYVLHFLAGLHRAATRSEIGNYKRGPRIRTPALAAVLYSMVADRSIRRVRLGRRIHVAGQAPVRVTEDGYRITADGRRLLRSLMGSRTEGGAR